MNTPYARRPLADLPAWAYIGKLGGIAAGK